MLRTLFYWSILLVIAQCAQVREVPIKMAIQLPADYYVGEKAKVTPGYWERQTPLFYDRKSVLYFFCTDGCFEVTDQEVALACARVEKESSAQRPGWPNYNNSGVCKFLEGDYESAYNLLVQAGTLAQDYRVDHNLRVTAHVLQEVLRVVKSK